MNIEHKDNYIYMKDGNNNAGYIKYLKMNDQVIDVITTYVDEKYRGQGIAGKLFVELVNFAREENYMIKPSCSYIKKKLENSTEYKDIYYYG